VGRMGGALAMLSTVLLGRMIPVAHRSNVARLRNRQGWQPCQRLGNCRLGVEMITRHFGRHRTHFCNCSVAEKGHNHYTEFDETFVPRPSVHLLLNITSESESSRGCTDVALCDTKMIQLPWDATRRGPRWGPSDFTGQTTW
jgi:hypothetical protein